MNKRFEIRHPEKLKNQSVPMPKKPSWIKVKAPLSEGYKQTKKLVKENDLKTCLLYTSPSPRDNR